MGPESFPFIFTFRIFSGFNLLSIQRSVKQSEFESTLSLRNVQQGLLNRPLQPTLFCLKDPPINPPPLCKEVEGGGVDGGIFLGVGGGGLFKGPVWNFLDCHVHVEVICFCCIAVSVALPAERPAPCYPTRNKHLYNMLIKHSRLHF